MRRTLATFSLSLFILLGLATPVSAVEVFTDICHNKPDAVACQDANHPENPSNNSFFGPHGVLTAATNIIAILVGIASVIMIIVGGLRYIISSGDPTNINNAKNAIFAALIGLVIAVMARGIVIFVLNRL